MSEYATPPTTHKKQRGKIRRCDWCGQAIQIGEIYEKWLWHDGGERSTVYAHKECASIWNAGDFPCGDFERPEPEGGAV